MIGLLTEAVVPVRLEAREHPDLSRRLSLAWTPTLTVLHARGAAVRQWIGFLPPDAFADEVRLAVALSELRSGRAAEAAGTLERLVEARPGACLTPEAMYWRGVALYRARGDKAPLWAAWRELADRHPSSPWAARTTLLQPGWSEHPAPASA